MGSSISVPRIHEGEYKDERDNVEDRDEDASLSNDDNSIINSDLLFTINIVVSAILIIRSEIVFMDNKPLIGLLNIIMTNLENIEPNKEFAMVKMVKKEDVDMAKHVLKKYYDDNALLIVYNEQSIADLKEFTYGLFKLVVVENLIFVLV